MKNSALPHSAAIRDDIKSYLNDLEALAIDSIQSKDIGDIFRNIYKITLAVDAVLLELTEELAPHPNALRSGFRKIPIYIALSQSVAACYQLRQLIEVTLLTVYFSQHPVEWSCFIKNSGSGLSQDQGTPILYGASRPPAFFRNYAAERFCDEPSGLVKGKLDVMASRYADLSRIVHGSKAVAEGELIEEFAKLSKSDLGKFCKIYKDVASSCAVVLMAFNVDAYNQLPPATRAWFGWLIGKADDSVIKSGPFGLSDAF